MKYISETSRALEFIIGFLGGAISLIAAIILLVIGNLDFGLTLVFGMIGSILGMISCFYLKDDVKYAGLALIISATLVASESNIFGIIGSILILIAGILALFRK